MYPSYIKQHGFDSKQTKFAGIWSLYETYDHSDQPTGISAVFISGNAGINASDAKQEQRNQDLHLSTNDSCKRRHL
ncbi:4697_t:CDS:2 [Gigaspora margarita]|uniref:4697_t:CDS:1 n=1 Tax=Gigaspora margarita TaxID=4874 RepID=A0ABN7VG56_GIGMA|nr:4697_t:CDS:2 [Gigaspora margarita]